MSAVRQCDLFLQLRKRPAQLSVHQVSRGARPLNVMKLRTEGCVIHLKGNSLVSPSDVFCAASHTN